MLPTKPAVVAVRPNPTNYPLDFSELSKKVEKTISRNLIADKRSVSVVGLPGCGKTVILRGVAYNPSVMAMFRDGIFFVQLTHQTTVDSLFENLSEIMEKCAMQAQAISLRELSKSRDFDKKQAIDLFVCSLKDKRLLLILDNVSEQSPQLYNVLVNITTFAMRPQRKFSILSSTRSVDVAKRFGSSAVHEVSLPEPSGETARAIMCCHAGFDRVEFDKSCSKEDNGVIPVLEKCAGLPLALAVAGGAVKRLLNSGKTPQENEAIWGHYRTYLCGNFNQFGQISGLYAAFASCVDRVPREKDWRTDASVAEVLSGLGIMPKGAWVPYQILQRTWGLKKKEDVITVVRPLSKLCLLSRARRGPSVGVMVPEIVLEYCRHEAEEKKMMKTWHMKLLKSYVDQGRRFAAVVQITEDEGGVKWERSRDEDEYLRENLQHHAEAVRKAADVTEDEKKIVDEACRVIENQFLQPLLEQTE